MPKQLCRNRPSCSALVERGFCPDCQEKGEAREKRPNSTQRGYGARWQKASRAYLVAHPIAVDWFKDHNGRVFMAEVVDHVIPHKGDMKLFWDSTNWQGLTKADHDRKTAMEDGGFGYRRAASSMK